MLQQVMSLSAHLEDILAMSARNWFELKQFQFLQLAGCLIRARVRGAKQAHNPLWGQILTRKLRVS